MDNEEQVPRLLHQLVSKTHIGIARRCYQCLWDRDVYTLCHECPEKPWLCSTFCFEMYHQRMHPELYPSLLPIFSPSVQRTREGQYRGPSRFQFRFRQGPEPKCPKLHQLTYLGGPRTPAYVDPVRGAGRRGRPRSLRVRGRPRSGPRQRRVAPAPCVQCFYEKHIRKITRLMCCKCSECPGLCSSYCFQRYHQRMHPEMYQARLPTITLSSAIRLRQGLKFDRNHSNSY